MNSQQSPLIPQGSLLEQKNKGRARVKIAVFFVLAVHGVGLLALLMQGCRQEDTKKEQELAAVGTNAAPETPTFVEPTNAPPPAADTNVAPPVAPISAPPPPPP